MIPAHLNKRLLKAPNEIIPFTDPRIKWPKYGSIKYDGHRMLAINGTWFVTPSGKEHVNMSIPLHFEDLFTWCASHEVILDGELWSPIRPFNELQSILRTRDGNLPDDVGYYVFDAIPERDWGAGAYAAYKNRYDWLDSVFAAKYKHAFLVHQERLDNPYQAEAFYTKCLEDGHEGCMLRSPGAGYKHGRCTHREDHIFKFKQFVTEDATIVGYEQMRALRPGVERTTNQYGLLERTYRDEDYELTDAIGSFIVTQDGTTTFKVKPGKGHTLEDRRSWFRNVRSLNNTRIEFTFMPHGTKDAPRLGTLVRFRAD